jgi:phosphoribosylanthranilate isomerase
MFRIKICGITTLDDARAACDAGADAIGLNFFSKSSRFVAPETARQIARALPSNLLKVGVFVNRSAADISQTVERVGLNCVQLHGAEQPDLIGQLPAAVPIVRAWQSSRDKLETLVIHLALCRLSARMPDAILLDASSQRDFGGTGQVADWQAIVDYRSVLGDIPLILAGGLTPENVAGAIAMVRPAGVDVASGVEREPGRKRASLMIDFVEAARAAFDRL